MFIMVISYLLKAGTMEARDLKLTVETLKCREEGKLEVETGLIKKVSNTKLILLKYKSSYFQRSFRSMRNPVKPPVGFFNRKLSTRHKVSRDGPDFFLSKTTTADPGVS